MIKFDSQTSCYTCGHFYLLQTSDIYYKMLAGKHGYRHDPPPPDVKHYYFECTTCHKEVCIGQEGYIQHFTISRHARENCKERK